MEAGLCMIESTQTIIIFRNSNEAYTLSSAYGGYELENT